MVYPLSYRHVEELMEERGVSVDHATLQRWVVKYSPQLEEVFHRRKRSAGVSWRMDETYIKVKGQWRYLYRAVDKHGRTIDFLLTQERNEQAAKHFLTKAIRRHGLPEKITIDGSAANEAAIKSYNKDQGTTIVIRQMKYLNNIVEIVFAQLTKTCHLAARMGGDDIADFHVTIGHQDPINQEFHHGPLLCKRRVSEAGPHPLAKRRHGLHHPSKFVVPISLDLELFFPDLQSVLLLCPILTPSLIF